MPTLIVLAGPPLPGRWSLARALQRSIALRRFSADGALSTKTITRALAAGCWVLIDGDLARAEERHRALALYQGNRVLVEWRCGRAEAEREIFRRYASRPDLLAQAELEHYLADLSRREPAVSALPGILTVHVGVEFPLDEQLNRVLGALPERPPRVPPHGALRVMVVEDDPDERTLLCEVLAELGVTVELAADGLEALALLDQGAEVELLISDQKMPGMSGVELSRALAQRHPRVRTVLFTAYTDEETCRAAVRAQAVTVLAKPLRVIDLERVLDEAVV